MVKNLEISTDHHVSGSFNLIGCNIIEKDINNEVLWTWTFPSITEDQQKFVMRKCLLDTEPQSTQPFIFVKCGKEWCYITTVQVFETDNLPRVKQFAFVIWAKDYNPDKYETLCRLLSKRYCKTGNTAIVLQLYLSVLSRGVCTTEENGTFLISDFDKQKSNFQLQIKELIRMFGPETILIYTSLLLNKKLMIYHHSLETLLKWIRTFPYLVSHRNMEDSIYPWVNLVDDEIAQLKASSGFIAGCRNSSVCARTDLYDILVNLPARELSISNSARESFNMTKTHKEIAMFMIQLADNQTLLDIQVVDEIAKKTDQLLQYLRSLATINMPDGQKMLSFEILKEKNLPSQLEAFLFQLALTEKMILL